MSGWTTVSRITRRRTWPAATVASDVSERSFARKSKPVQQGGDPAGLVYYVAHEVYGVQAGKFFL